jgi:hypothetical protein
MRPWEEESEMEFGTDWEPLPEDLIGPIEALGQGTPEVVFVVTVDGEGQRTRRTFARDGGDSNPQTPDSALGDLTLFGGELVSPNPGRCYWNGKKWVCY